MTFIYEIIREFLRVTSVSRESQKNVEASIIPDRRDQQSRLNERRISM